MGHKICAYPKAISCGLGAIFVLSWGAVAVLQRYPWEIVTGRWETVVWGVAAMIPLGLLGCVLPRMMLFWPVVRWGCCRYNGRREGPLKVGDRVRILSGKCAGKEAQVVEVVVGQGGWELARVDAGCQGGFLAEYEVVRV